MATLVLFTEISLETISRKYGIQKYNHFLIIRCFAYNAEEIRVGRVPSGVVGKPVEFESMRF